MHQQLARARLLVAELACGSVGADMDALEKRLAVLDARVAVAQICAMRPQRLDLGAGEREAGLERLLDEEVVPRLAVVDDQVEAVGGGFAVAVVSVARHLGLSASLSGTRWRG